MPPADTARRVVRFQDVCTEVGLSPTTMRKLCRAGKGPPLLQLSQRRLGVRRGDLDAWVDGLKKPGRTTLGVGEGREPKPPR